MNIPRTSPEQDSKRSIAALARWNIAYHSANDTLRALLVDYPQIIKVLESQNMAQLAMNPKPEPVIEAEPAQSNVIEMPVWQTQTEEAAEQPSVSAEAQAQAQNIDDLRRQIQLLQNEAA